MKHLLISIIISSLFLSSCEINEQFPYSDIIPEDMWDIIGMWQIDNISGGLAGWSYEPNFDFLSIRPNGCFSFIDNSSEIASGNIEFVDYDEDTLLFFNLDSIFPLSVVNMGLYFPKYIMKLETTTLILADPCCDLFTYSFIK